MKNEITNSVEDSITPRQEIAYRLYQHAVDLVRKQSSLFFDIGQTFKEIRDEKMYQHMGEGGFDSWEEFLAQPDIYLAPQTVRAYIYIYEIYIEKLGLDKNKLIDVPFYKLNMLASFIKNLEPDRAAEIIDSLKELGARDFNLELKELKGEEINEKTDVRSKSEREEDDLAEIFENMKNDVIGAKDTDDVLHQIKKYKDIVMSWHKRFKQ